MSTLITTALRIEQYVTRAGLPAGSRVPVYRLGLGPQRATRSIARLTGDGRSVEGLLLAGVGGGLSGAVRPGDLVVADAVQCGDHVVPLPGAPLLAGALRRLGLTVHVGPVVSSASPVDGRDREALARTGALVVDMESAALAGSLDRLAPGAAIAVVRAVADTSDRPLLHPATVQRGIVALGSLRRSAPALQAWAEAVGRHQVLLAGPRSFCAGVHRAIDSVDGALRRYGAPVYVRRQIVHNTHVVSDLERRGAVFVDELDQVPAGSVAVLAAHGVAPGVREQARARRLRLVDATCPLVAKVHVEARRYATRGDTVLLIGHADHEEVEGTVGEAPRDILVVEDVAAARTVRPADPSRVAYVMQTTLAVDDAEAIASVLRERFPHIAAPRTDDICFATTNRQDAVRAVARGCDVVLVLGSANSSNSRRLVEVAQRSGVPAHLVEDAGEVDLRWLAGAARIGVTAGASAPPMLVDDLIDSLGGLGPLTRDELTIADEAISFALPPEVS